MQGRPHEEEETQLTSSSPFRGSTTSIFCGGFSAAHVGLASAVSLLSGLGVGLTGRSCSWSIRAKAPSMSSWSSMSWPGPEGRDRGGGMAVRTDERPRKDEG